VFKHGVIVQSIKRSSLGTNRGASLARWAGRRESAARTVSSRVFGFADAAQVQVNAMLAAKIGKIIKHRHLTQTQAADMLGMPQPKRSGMLRGQFRGISEAKMLAYLNRLGSTIQIVVRKPSRARAIGGTSAVFA
jgi:predicted XRE-type DNA-binding protein